MVSLPRTLLEDYQDRLAEPSHLQGGGNDIQDEMPYLLARAEQYMRVRVLEIGVRSGRSTSAFLAAAARMNGHVWSIDMAEPQVPESWRTCGYWTFKQAMSNEVTPELEGWPASFDVLFIDGDHSTAAALGDLRRYVPYVAPGGVVLCHDTKLANAAALPPIPEVAVALDLFCAEYHLAARELPAQRGVLHTPEPLTWTERGGQFGLGVIESPNG
jgi:predicted O-methyltransferase YrrM